jgi:hypothetical protein
MVVKSFIVQVPGVNLIKAFGLNILTLFCKLDNLILVGNFMNNGL